MSLATLIEPRPGSYSVYAKNLQTEKSVGYDEHRIMPSASLIKVPIMAEVFRRVEEEYLSLDDTLVMKKEDQVPGSGVLIDLSPGLRLSLRDLTMLMITVSDNTATNMLIDYLSVDAVNLLIRRLGLQHTVLERRLERIPVEHERINRTTSYDMTRLMELLATGQVVSVDVSRRMVDILSRCQGPLSIGALPKAPRYVGQLPLIRFAHKTGSLNEARHDSGIMYHGNDVYVMTILSAGLPEADLLKQTQQIGKSLLRFLK